MGKTEALVDPDIPDDENPEWTHEDFARAKPIWAFPQAVAALRRGGQLPEAALDRETVTLRLDPDLLARSRTAEEGWKDHANATLRRALSLPL